MSQNESDINAGATGDVEVRAVDRSTHESGKDTSDMSVQSDLDPDSDGQDGQENGDMFIRGDEADGSDWEVYRSKHMRKRQRRSTGEGGASSMSNFRDYKKLSLDDKMLTMFTAINGIGDKVDRCLSLNTKVNKLEEDLESQDSRILYLEYKALDLEARSRRNNLLIKGLPEVRDENCSQTVSEFLDTHLGIDTCPAIPRVHRLGKYKRDTTRPIIVNFLDFRDTEFIISKANKLAGTDFSINRDYPKEIADARKGLWAKRKDLRRDFPQSKIGVVYPAKLVKDGRTVADKFPHWQRILYGIPKVPDQNMTEDSTHSTHKSGTSVTQATTRSSLFSHVVQQAGRDIRQYRHSRTTSRSPAGRKRDHAPARGNPVSVNSRAPEAGADRQPSQRRGDRSPNFQGNASDRN